LRCFIRSHGGIALRGWQAFEAGTVLRIGERPAVSIITASLVNHQAQFTVPAFCDSVSCALAAPICSATGNLRPEFNKADVLPAPGVPMIMYQGNSYR
jgi:hypothetical protein